MSFTIRRADRRDLDTLGRLGAALMRIHYAFDPKRFIAPYEGVERGYASFLGSVLDAPDNVIFVAEQNDAIVGYVYAALEPPSWKELRAAAGFIHDVIVDERSRRCGAATALMHAALDWMREHGAPRALLGSAAPNAAAQRLFHRLGFRDTMIEMTIELNE